MRDAGGQEVIRVIVSVVKTCRLLVTCQCSKTSLGRLVRHSFEEVISE